MREKKRHREQNEKERINTVKNVASSVESLNFLEADTDKFLCHLISKWIGVNLSLVAVRN